MGADNSKDKKSPVDHFKQAFGDVRILVIGGSGAGKSAVIRCMGFGDELAEVPQSVHRRAPAGQQDMAVPVWKHPELPLFIHDTNGVGSNGKARVADISKFLETDHPRPYRFWRRIWRAAPSISDRVHLVWFVLSATDNRILEFNAELMELVGKHRIPVQIIVTHLDQVSPGAYNRNVGNHLDELLAAAGLSADATQKVKGSIVKVSLAHEDDAHADEDAEERVKQKQALKELSRKTAELLDEKQQGQRLTWAAAQSVDVRAKLQETAKLVVCRQYLEWAEYFSPAVVSVNKTALLCLLRVVRDSIGAIWGAPPALKAAVFTGTRWEPDPTGSKPRSSCSPWHQLA